MLELKNISKKYGSNQVLSDINLSFAPGTVHGIVGRNGAGKSTLFSSIAGIIAYDGSIDTPWSPLNHHLAFLPTDPYILSKITGREYLRFIQLAQKEKGPIDKQNIFNLPLDRYASQYSTGMKKKLAFTGLLMARHEVLLLDEPFNGVDIQSNIIITEIISRWKEMGKIVLISSHIFSSLGDVCDEIHLLENGQILMSAEKGRFNEVEDQMRALTLDQEVDNLKLL